MKPIIPGAALEQHIAAKRKAYYAAYYQANKERWRSRQRSPKSRAYMKAWRAKNREYVAAELKAWAARNPERARAIALKHQIARRPRKRLADRRYRQDKPEQYRASIARAKAANPELYRRISVKSSLARRARKRAAIVERVSLKRISIRDRGCCHLCALPVERAQRSHDHLIPIVRNGAHAEWNLMLAHIRCNKRRGTKQILPVETKEAAAAYIAARCAGAT